MPHPTPRAWYLRPVVRESEVLWLAIIVGYTLAIVVSAPSLRERVTGWAASSRWIEWVGLSLLIGGIARVLSGLGDPLVTDLEAIALLDAYRLPFGDDLGRFAPGVLLLRRITASVVWPLAGPEVATRAAHGLATVCSVLGLWWLARRRLGPLRGWAVAAWLVCLPAVAQTSTLASSDAVFTAAAVAVGVVLVGPSNRQTPGLAALGILAASATGHLWIAVAFAAAVTVIVGDAIPVTRKAVAGATVLSLGWGFTRFWHLDLSQANLFEVQGALDLWADPRSGWLSTAGVLAALVGVFRGFTSKSSVTITAYALSMAVAVPALAAGSTHPELAKLAPTDAALPWLCVLAVIGLMGPTPARDAWSRFVVAWGWALVIPTLVWGVRTGGAQDSVVDEQAGHLAAVLDDLPADAGWVLGPSIPLHLVLLRRADDPVAVRSGCLNTRGVDRCQGSEGVIARVEDKVAGQTRQHLASELPKIGYYTILKGSEGSFRRSVLDGCRHLSTRGPFSAHRCPSSSHSPL